MDGDLFGTCGHRLGYENAYHIENINALAAVHIAGEYDG